MSAAPRCIRIPSELACMTTSAAPRAWQFPTQAVPSGRGQILFSSLLRRGMLVPGGLALVGLIAFLDYVTGPDLSVTLFYLIPAAAVAWWGGLPHGILIALAGSISWHFIDVLENP